MSRTHHPRRPTGIKAEVLPSPPDEQLPAESPAERARLGVGWRIALLVWMLGFGALMLVELWKFVSMLLLR
jgi:hypothetical protein